MEEVAGVVARKAGGGGDADVALCVVRPKVGGDDGARDATDGEHGLGEKGLTSANLLLMASTNPVHVGTPWLRSTQQYH